MMGRIYKFAASGVIALVVAVISLTSVCLAATSPVVTVLAPVAQGMRSPVKIVIDAAGNYYVADQRVGVIKYNQYGTPVMTIKTSGIPMGVALAQDGSILVSQGTFVAAYDQANGTELFRFGTLLKGAAGIAVNDETGYIYVADSAANEVHVYTAAGLLSSKIGTGSRSVGSALPVGQLSMPTGVVFEKVSRQLVVADTMNNRVQFFDVNGAFVKSIGLASNGSTGPMRFASPQSIAFEYTKGQSPAVNRMYVVDAFQSNVQVVDPAGVGTALNVSGTLNNYIGAYGAANGQLIVPTDAVFDQKNNRLIVVNGYGNLSMFGIDGGSNPVDMTPPALSIDPVLSNVSVPVISLSGTMAAGAQVTVSAGVDVLVGAVVYPAATTWKAAITNLTPGVNILSVTAQNSAGAITPVQSVSVKYVLSAPMLAVTSSIPAVTNDAALVLSGTVDVGSTVTITNTANAVVNNATVSGTVWNFTASLSEGPNTFAVTAQKLQSAVNEVSVKVTLDTMAPLLSVSALSDGSYTSDPVQNITGSFADAGIVNVSVIGAQAPLVDNTFSMVVSLVNGKNYIVVSATDAAGNSATDLRSLYFDITKPLVTIVSPMDNSFTNSASLVISGQVDKTSTVTVAGVPVVVGANNQWSTSVNLVAGVNTIEIVATDLYGNTSATKRTVTFDTVNPVISVVSPAQDIAVNKPNLTVAGTVNDNVSSLLTYTLNGVTLPVLAVDGSFAFNVDFTAEGVYSVMITAIDPAGNVSQTTRNIIYDVTPPALTLNTSSGAAPDKLSGTVEAGSNVVIKESSTVIGSVVAAGSEWSANLAGVSYNPENLYVVATDAAGNSSVKTLAYNFPNGTLNANGVSTVKDALRAIRLVVNNTTPTAQELAHYDIGPLFNGMPNPNGKIDLVDAILILRKSLGLKSW